MLPIEATKNRRSKPCLINMVRILEAALTQCGSTAMKEKRPREKWRKGQRLPGWLVRLTRGAAQGWAAGIKASETAGSAEAGAARRRGSRIVRGGAAKGSLEEQRRERLYQRKERRPWPKKKRPEKLGGCRCFVAVE
jgi:hypothetical protein